MDSSGRVQPHLLYQHIEKSGGSSIECATARTHVVSGRWSNLGHVKDQSLVYGCMASCTFDHVLPLRVISVRDPYSFARSRYLYEWSCAYSNWCSISGGHFQRWMSFEAFIQTWASPQSAHYTQSEILRRACGTPCDYDRILFTENLTAGWTALQLDTGLLPAYALPRTNPSQPGALGTPPRTIFTRVVTDILERVEARMFSEFGYAKRTPPFELGHAPFVDGPFEQWQAGQQWDMQDCWESCGSRSGPCPSTCGLHGACCRRDIDQGLASCGFGTLGCERFHCCVSS